MHGLLRRQIRRFLDPEQPLPESWSGFLEAVSAAYEQFDVDRELLERSMELSSQELLQANAELRVVLRSFPDVFLRIDADGLIKGHQADTGGELLESHRHLLGRRVTEIDPDEPAGVLGRAARDVLASGAMVTEEYALRTVTSLRHCESRLVPLLGDQVLVVIRDITESIQHKNALLEEKERLAVTLRSIGDGVITTDVTGRVELLNKAAETLLGWSLEEARGRTINEIFPLADEESGRPCPNPVDQALRSGIVAELPRYALLCRRDGSTRLVADSAAPIKDSRSVVIGAVLVFRDVTEKVKMEQEHFKTAKLESIGVLAGGIAHDFNNSLNAVLSNISLLKMDIGLGAKTLERLDRMEKSIYQARELTQQLLTFAKGGEPVRKTARVNDLVVENARFVLSGSKARSEFDIADDLWPVEADLGQLSQVISNLVINAVQAMPDGGTVRVAARNLVLGAMSDLPLAPGRYITIRVQDDGMGILANNLERIFDPYHTTKEQGSGLGLATCHSIITKHEGCITVSSEVGRGSTFTVHLPAASGPCLFEQDAAADEPLPKAHGRILILDDEESILEPTCELLELMGFEAIGVRDGQKAVEHYASAKQAGTPYDLLILDLTIPGGMGGKEVIRILNDLDPQVKAIVSSGYSQDPVMARHAEYGFCDVLAKPYKMDELRKVVTRQLREDA